MKILHIISQHPESTGSGIYLQNIIRQAAAAGHQNFLVAGISGSKVPKLDCIDHECCRFLQFETEDLDFLIPGMSDVMPYPSSTFKQLSTQQIEKYQQRFSDIIRQAIATFSPDIIHSHHLWLVSSIARQISTTLPMVCSCHSTDLRQFEQCSHLQKHVLKQCQKIPRILALSRNQKERIHNIYAVDNKRIEIVGGGYDDTLFTQTRKESPEPVQLLYAGKLSFAKGVDWLLTTFLQLKDQRLHLHLAGSGAGIEAQKCLELASKAKMNGDPGLAGTAVTVHGKISQQDLAKLMGRCHIFILPSFYEGLPLVLLEALACGCRIITTDLPGCKELLTGADKDLVEFIPLPKLATIDRPRKQDLTKLETKLGLAISTMAKRAQLSPTVPSDKIHRLTSPFRWQEVFTKIALSYEKVVGENV